MLAATGLSLGEPVNGVFEFICTLNHHYSMADTLLSRHFLCWLHLLDFLKLALLLKEKTLMDHILWLPYINCFIPVVYTLSYWLFFQLLQFFFCNFTPPLFLIILFSFCLLGVFLNFSFCNICNFTLWSNSLWNFSEWKELRKSIK